MEVSTEPVIKITTRKSVLAVEFSPFEWSQTLLAVALPSSLSVYTFNLNQENEDEVSLEQIWEAHVDSQTVAIAWSPNSSLRSSPKCLELLVATEDHKILQLMSDLLQNDLVKEQCHHLDYINSITYSADSGELAASTGDDLVAKVWNTETLEVVAKFLLTSPGVGVKFSPDDPDMLIVAEREGSLRMYSISGACATLALQSPAPVLSMDWSDSSVLAASGPKMLSVWSLNSQLPSRETVVIGDSLVTNVKLCKSVEGLVATVSHPHTLKVSHLQANRIPMVANLKVISSISWHLQSPYLAVGSDRKVLIWKIENV